MRKAAGGKRRLAGSGAIERAMRLFQESESDINSPEFNLTKANKKRYISPSF
jgi:hypothetical protein